MIYMFLLLLLTCRHTEAFRLFPNNHGQSCLFTSYLSAGDSWSLIPYCFQSNSITNDSICQQHGQLMSFKQSRKDNISMEDLFRWQISVDIIDAYSKFDALTDTDRTYCNCSTFHWFGSSCQYTFETPELTLENIVDQPIFIA
jgi:hypothetical protein